MNSSYLNIRGTTFNGSLSNEIELQPLAGADLVADACRDVGRAHADLHAFTRSCLPSSVKHYLLWGAVGLTAATGVVSATVGGLATVSFAGAAVIDGVNHLADDAQANHPETSEWFFPGGGAVLGAVTALLVSGSWYTTRWMVDLIGRENAERVNAFKQEVEAAETRLAKVVTDLSGSEWESFLRGLKDERLAMIVESFRLLPEDRLVQAMDKIVDGGFVHRIGLSSLSPESKGNLRAAYSRYGDQLVKQMDADDFQQKVDGCGRQLPHRLACMALSALGFASSLSDSLRSYLERPDMREKVHQAVHLLKGLSEVMGINMDHVHRFGDGVGGIGADLMGIAGAFPWVMKQPQP